MLPTVRVLMDRAVPGRGRVTVDGRQLPGVRAVTVHHEAGQPPRVTVEFNAAEAPVEYVDRLDPAEEVTRDGAARR
ncbi:MAG: hypothetical protein HOQ43_07510 [Glycomyces artemisiae]|uniref:Uncharacterized protein n=1 Tax=Glycomyces artemisiae TaxID=1076443 RepID=A0A850C215_9ACTN|nr:hypothetical protein [Glycomyces artemisiae]